VSALAFTTTCFTLDWAHTINSQQPDDSPDSLQGHELS